MSDSTATTSSSVGTEKPEMDRTEELVQYGGPHDPKDYVAPDVELSPDDEVWFRTVVQTADNAQQMFLDGRIDEDGLAKAVARFGKPSNPSEVVNRPDAAYERKLPKWVFSAPEGLGLSMEQRLKEVEATTPEPGPLNHERLVALPPEEQQKVAKEQREAAEKKERKTSTSEEESPTLTKASFTPTGGSTTEKSS